MSSGAGGLAPPPPDAAFKTTAHRASLRHAPAKRLVSVSSAPRAPSRPTARRASTRVRPSRRPRAPNLASTDTDTDAARVASIAPVALDRARRYFSNRAARSFRSARRAASRRAAICVHRLRAFSTFFFFTETPGRGVPHRSPRLARSRCPSCARWRDARARARPRRASPRARSRRGARRRRR